MIKKDKHEVAKKILISYYLYWTTTIPKYDWSRRKPVMLLGEFMVVGGYKL